MLLEKTKLFQTISALTPEERNQIPDFIASPIFYKGSNRERLIKLYGHIAVVVKVQQSR